MSLRGDKEIDDLLSMMGSSNDGSTLRNITAPDARKSNSEKAMKKKKKSEKIRRNVSEKRNRASFIRSRLVQNCFRWPQSSNGQRCLSLEVGLAHDCKGYVMPGHISNARELINYGLVRCDQCGKSSSTHELSVIFDSGASEAMENTPYIPLVSIIVATRNARCLMGEYFVPSKGSTEKLLLPATNSIQSTPSLISKWLDVCLGRVLAELRRLEAKSRTSNVMNNDDLVILKEKVQSMVKAISNFKKTTNDAKSDIDMINHRIEAMSCCDAVYYRCYYISIICCNSKSHADKNIDLIPFIPHPSTYFSCAGLAWDVFESGTKALNIFLGNSDKNTVNTKGDYAAQLNESTRKMLMNNWGLKSRLSLKAGTADNNPLLSLWQSRFIETIRHIWATGYSSTVSPRLLRSSTQLLARGAAFVDAAELPRNQAIAISTSVSLWRDSIRDYPANFYSYATPTASSLESILNCLKLRSNNESAVEAGAGTGYWSTLINFTGNKSDQSPFILPYDIAPPSHETPNLYHGKIPPFTDVKHADSADKSMTRSLQRSTPVLLLCYPPPGVDMAYKALSTHVQNGGSILIHIGEWQGLTGSTEFEKLLTRSFYCENIEFLPLWGTDATYLTIWQKQDHQRSKKNELFSPAFGYCSSYPCYNAAQRRCKFARCLQYCSQDCFLSHKSSRKAYLALHMFTVPLNSDLKFESDDHFVDLLTKEVQERKNKKRKKKH